MLFQAGKIGSRFLMYPSVYMEEKRGLIDIVLFPTS